MNKRMTMVAADRLPTKQMTNEPMQKTNTFIRSKTTRILGITCINLMIRLLFKDNMAGMKKFPLALLTLLLLSAPGFAQVMTFEDTLSGYFREIKSNTFDHKDLWNLDLYGPVLLVNPDYRKIYANDPDTAGALQKNGDLYTGILPANLNIANTALSWNGNRWAMIRLPLSQNEHERLEMLSHELFHRSQPTLGFKMNNPDNAHLDQLNGRVYLRLELAALWKAYLSGLPDSLKMHLTNAMIFRKCRYALFPGAVLNENLLELNEGLASYTGIVMSNRDQAETREYFEGRLTDFLHYPTFVRSFAYITTPLYGYLLDRTRKYWNQEIRDTSNLADYFVRAFGLSIPADIRAAALAVSGRYGGTDILREETSREQAAKQRIEKYKAMFIDGPHLVIRFENMNISFDPRNMVPLENSGTVYPTLRITDNWGILTVTNGALLATNWDKVTVTAPTVINEDKISGDGWDLTINKGYSVEKDKAGVNYQLRKLR
jgi:hypothetical protein